MKLVDLMVEAKLTDTGFQTAPARMIERYRDLEEVFDLAELMVSGNVIRGYQLIRGVLAAYVTGGSFCVLCDARRPDLIESWYLVHAGGQKLCSALPVAVADLAGIDSRAVQVPAEFSGGEIRHHSVKRLRLVSVLPSRRP